MNDNFFFPWYTKCILMFNVLNLHIFDFQVIVIHFYRSYNSKLTIFLFHFVMEPRIILQFHRVDLLRRLWQFYIIIRKAYHILIDFLKLLFYLLRLNIFFKFLINSWFNLFVRLWCILRCSWNSFILPFYSYRMFNIVCVFVYL